MRVQAFNLRRFKDVYDELPDGIEEMVNSIGYEVLNVISQRLNKCEAYELTRDMVKKVFKEAYEDIQNKIKDGLWYDIDDEEWKITLDLTKPTIDIWFDGHLVGQVYQDPRSDYGVDFLQDALGWLKTFPDSQKFQAEVEASYGYTFLGNAIAQLVGNPNGEHGWDLDGTYYVTKDELEEFIRSVGSEATLTEWYAYNEEYNEEGDIEEDYGLYVELPYDWWYAISDNYLHIKVNWYTRTGTEYTDSIEITPCEKGECDEEEER